MAKKLYVGNLPYKTTQDDLSAMFGKVGAVASSTVISDKFTGRSKGFGFVEFASDDDAEKAVKEFNGYDMDGRKLVVNEARPMVPRENRPGGSYDRRDDRGGRDRRDH
jgi:RNA recognition motif-containing protein